MHNYYAFGQCFKEKRKDQLNSVAWDQCIHQKEFIDMTKVIEGDNPNLPLNEDTLLKLDTLLEDDDLVQNASDVLNSFIKKDNTEEEARNAFHFMSNNNISPFGAKNTISNLASGVGKTMDSDEALGIYNKAEQGSNTIPNSHALQNFFETNKTSDNYNINSLMHGYGKTLDDTHMNSLMKQGFSGNLSDDKENLIYQKMNNEELPKDFPNIDSSPDEIRKALKDFYNPGREMQDGFAGRFMTQARGTILNKGFGVNDITELKDEYRAHHNIPDQEDYKDLRRQIKQNLGSDEASEINKKELLQQRQKAKDFYRNFNYLSK